MVLPPNRKPGTICIKAIDRVAKSDMLAGEMQSSPAVTSSPSEPDPKTPRHIYRSSSMKIRDNSSTLSSPLADVNPSYQTLNVNSSVRAPEETGHSNGRKEAIIAALKIGRASCRERV